MKFREKYYLKSAAILLICCTGFLQCKKDTNNPEPVKVPFVIENLGVTFGPWNKKTNLAGDFYFTTDLKKVFGEFGAQVLDPDWNIKELPTFDYIIRSDAFVFSICEGEVTGIGHQKESDDYEFSVQSLNDPSYQIVYDHVINLKIEVGDKVQPGDTLANPRPFNTKYGMVEIMINNLKTKRSYCPFCCFNEEKLDEYIQKVSQLMSDWEECKGDTTIYDQKNHVIPGCRMESMLTY